jgi:predicted ArsR family transcriptional regulator
MDKTRDRILKYIKGHNQVGVGELAEGLGFSTISVRHHLSALQAEGLIQSVEVRRGVGRPHLVFSLTDKAQERFQTKYLKFSERLLDELKATLPPAAIEAMFARMAEGMVAEYGSTGQGRSLEEKMDLLVEMLGAEGFMAKWNRAGETITLTEYNCPYVRIGLRHPEICTIDQTVIRQVLSADVEKTTCVLNGAERCVFVIKPQAELVFKETTHGAS